MMGQTLLVILALAASGTFPAEPAYTVEEARVGARPRGGGRVFHSQDGRHVGWATTVEGGQQVNIDGRPGPTYDGVGHLNFSPDGNRVAYSVLRGERWFVVCDGRESGPYEGIDPQLRGMPGPGYDDRPIEFTGAVRFSPDGSHLAYVALRAGKWFFVHDGREQRAYDRMHFDAFSPGGQHVVYSARRGNAFVTVVDGTEHPGMAPWRLAFSPDDHRWAYPGMTGGSRQFAVIDGERGPHHESVGPFVFSPDSRRLAYTAADRGGSCVVLDGVEGPRYERVWQPTFSPDSAHLAYRAAKDGRTFVILDGAVHQRGDVRPLRRRRLDITSQAIVFSPDSRHLAYAMYRGGEAFCLVDGSPGPAFAAVLSDPVFSADGSRIGYLAARGGEQSATVWSGGTRVAVRDGHVGPEFDEIGELQFSDDLSKLAYVGRRDGLSWLVVGDTAKLRTRGLLRVMLSSTGECLTYWWERGGKYRIILNGQECGPYDLVLAPTLSPDGRHAAFVVARWKTLDGKAVPVSGPEDGPGRYRCAVLLDGAEGPEYDSICVRDELHFCDDGALEYLAARDGELYRVRHLPTG